ncbi:PepSY domain-containing protein [Bosea sp. LjRoot237]|uniref:PepSY domain-containing protein n=1 Tax=Bosea sp. LjRoot237 TaxID=3342292 RepID=UPI003ECF5F11
MPTRRFVLIACLGLVPTAPALAQVLSSEIGAPPLDVPPPDAPTAPPYPPRPPEADDDDYGISRREAVRIARRNGVVDVDSVRRRRGVWIVSGTDDDDEDIRVVVNDEGDVVAVRRD